MIQPRPNDTMPPTPGAAGPKPDPLRVLETLLDHVDRLANSDASTAQFYGWLCTNFAAALQLKSAWLFRHHENSGLMMLASEVGSRPEKGWEARLATALIGQRKSAGDWDWHIWEWEDQQILVSQQAVSASEQLFFVLCPQRAVSTQEQKLFGDLCREISQSMVGFERGQQQKLLEQKLARHDDVLRTATRLSSWQSPAAWRRSLVNDLAALFRCDRVSLFSVKGRLLAVSGVSQLNRHAAQAKVWRPLARLCGKTARILDAEEVASWTNPARTRAWRRALETSGTEVTRLFPIKSDGQPRSLGVLLVENFQAETSDPAQFRRFCEETLTTLAPFVEQRQAIADIPSLRLQVWLGRYVWRRPVRLALQVAGLLGLLSILVWQLFYIHRPFEIAVSGHLEPAEIRSVFATVAGRVDRYLVPHETIVESGSPLVQISSLELEQELARNQGQLAEALQTLSMLQVELTQTTTNSAERVKLSSEMEQTKVRIESYREIDQILTERQERLRVTAPSPGLVLSEPFQKKLLTRPVSGGEPLLEIAEIDGDWRLKVAIEERHLGYLIKRQQEQSQAIPVRFRLVTFPDEVFYGHLSEIDILSRRQMVAEGQSPGHVVAYIQVDKKQLADRLRLGTGVWARIDCGEASGWFLLTYELRDKLREWFFF